MSASFNSVRFNPNETLVFRRFERITWVSTELQTRQFTRVCIASPELHYPAGRAKQSVLWITCKEIKIREYIVACQGLFCAPRAYFRLLVEIFSKTVEFTGNSELAVFVPQPTINFKSVPLLTSRLDFYQGIFISYPTIL